ncbi:MAG: hypothetical protein LH629_11335, partial [Ignavibacteria bacterium]|nr:hypothetical protein [Ignavibacteria bacterium]
MKPALISIFILMSINLDAQNLSFYDGNNAVGNTYSFSKSSGFLQLKYANTSQSNQTFLMNVVNESDSSTVEKQFFISNNNSSLSVKASGGAALSYDYQFTTSGTYHFNLTDKGKIIDKININIKT